MADHADVAAAIVAAGKRLHQRGLIASIEGNISVRLDDGRVVMTPTGAHKGRLDAEALAVLGADGRPQGGGAPSSELPMHLAIYEERPDLRAIVHAHPPTATGFAVAGRDLPRAALAETITLLGCVPIAPYGAPSTAALADTVREPIRGFDVVLLANHGAIAAGADLALAEERMVQLEHFAQISLVAHQLGGPRSFTRAQVEQLSALREAAGSPPVPAACYPSTGESGTITLTREELVELIADALHSIR